MKLQNIQHAPPIQARRFVMFRAAGAIPTICLSLLLVDTSAPLTCDERTKVDAKSVRNYAEHKKAFSGEWRK